MSALRWLIHEWPSATLFTAGFLLVLSPFLAPLGLPLLLIFLQLPIYQIHQFEEHHRDRFRLFANQLLAGGREAFTPTAIFVINSAGVWGVNLLALYLAYFCSLSWGLIAIYLTLVNALSHVGMAIALRRANPGVWTSLALFLPMGGWALVVVSRASAATWGEQAIGLGTALLIHAGIILFIRIRIRKLQASA